jgi:hypothetical protein
VRTIGSPLDHGSSRGGVRRRRQHLAGSLQTKPAPALRGAYRYARYPCDLDRRQATPVGEQHRIPLSWRQLAHDGEDATSLVTRDHTFGRGVLRDVPVGIA